MSPVRTIWAKELRDTLRDRRTLMIMVIVPVLLMPLLTVGLTALSRWQMEQARKQEIHIGVFGMGNAPALMAALRSHPKVVLEPRLDLGTLKKEVREKELHAGLFVPEGFEEGICEDRPGQIVLFLKGSNFLSMVAAARIDERIQIYRDTFTQTKLAGLGVDASILSLVQLQRSDLATKAERGGFLLGFILPMCLVIWAIMGGMYTAIDVSAGEKERFTLEAVLFTPAGRMQITLGKFLAVFTVAFCAVVASLISLGGSFALFPPDFGSGPGEAVAEMQSQVHLEPAAILVMLLLSGLLAAAFSALLLAMGIFAHSFKEAQNLINPLYLVVILPVVGISAVPGMKPDLWLFAIPGLNAALIFKDALVNTYDPVQIGVCAASLVAFAAASLALAAFCFTRERVLMRI